MNENRINIMGPDIPVAPQPAAPEEPKVEYASVPERFVALLIDYGVVFIPVSLILWIYLKIAGPLDGIWPPLFLLLGLNFLFVLYEAVFSCGDRVTLGKALVGIAVMKADLSGPISFPRAFLRAIGYYVSALLLMCGFLLAFFDDRRRALQDRLGDSVVVRVRAKSWGERVGVQLVGALLLVVFGWVFYEQVLGGGSLTKQAYIRQAEKQLRNIALLEEAHYNRYGHYTNDLLRLSLLSGDPVQFQRDTQKVLYHKGFKIGVQGDTYKISARAQDPQHTPVYFAPPQR